MGAEQHEAAEITPVLRAGASLVACKPVFSSDSKWLVCGCGSDVRVYSVASGECVQTLKGHKKRVTALALSPENPYQLLSCGLDNKLIKWNYADGIKLRTFRLATSLVRLLSSNSKGRNIHGVRHVPTKDTYDVVQLQLPERGADHINVTHLGIPSNEKAMVALGGENHFLAALNTKLLTVCPLNRKKQDSWHKYKPSNEFDFTCLTCHPLEHCVATGLSNGQIVLWWNVLGKEAVQTIYHWHSLPVLSLVFTTQGSYLLSGGHECVLVKWQTNSQDRDVIPRLGAPIVDIVTSKNNSLYAVCHSDNSLQILTSSLRVLQVLQGLTRRHLPQWLDNPIPAGLVVDPRTNSIVTNGRLGHLQFYSLHTDKQLYNLDIVCQNYISPENLENPLAMTEVERAAFDSTGTWLATVQYRNDDETTPELFLKFWLFKEETQMYELNTTVDLPHSERVDCLCFRPIDGDWPPMAATSSADGKFKLWQLVDDTDIYKSNQCWSCESVGFYRDFAAGAMDFSEDGSLLAVAFQTSLTLWDPDSNGLRTTLTDGTNKNPIKHVKFGLGSCSHLVVCATSSQMYVWNLLTCSVEWTESIEIGLLTGDPCSEYMAYLTGKGHDLVVFRPSEASPVFKFNHVSPSAVLGAVFLPHQQEILEFPSDEKLQWQCKSQLYMLNESQELLTVARSLPESDTENQIAQSIAEHIQPTQFSALLHSQRKKGLQEESATEQIGQIGLSRSEFLKQMLETPAHVLPAISTLCSSFLGPLLPAAKNLSHQLSDDDSDTDEEPQRNKSDSESEMEVEGNPNTSVEEITSDSNSKQIDSEEPVSLLSLESLHLHSSEKLEELERVHKSSFSWMNKL